MSQYEYNACNWIPYWWCELDNQVYLVNDYEEAFDIYFPETETNVNDTNSYRIDLEYYTITCKIEGVTIDKKVAQIDETENFEIICYGDVPSAIDVKENNESKLEGSFEINGNIITIYKVSGNIEILSNSSNKSTTEPVDCLASGTKITMADGSIKNIESVKEGDFILTFNHITGKYEGQKVYLTYKGETEKTAFTLNFSDGKKLSIIGDHALFEKESNTYVSIFENTADNFIGKHFYNASSNDYVKLLSVTYETEPTDYYEIYTEYNANCIAENMLNAPYDVINFLIIFDYNSDLTINKYELEQDISKYGLYERPDDAEYSYELFDALNWKYANIIVGKGLATWEELFTGRDEFLNNY